MNLLIITQKVDKNDPILGFFHRWIEEFAKNVESVIVICLERGEYDLPSNVKVLSLGKEKLEAKSYKLKAFAKLKYVWRFYKYIFKFRKEYDSVFVHMNQVYVILGGIFWRLLGKKTALWYTHRQITLSLWFAEKITNIIFTASKESFRLKSKKVEVMGHGIDTGHFKQDSQNKISDTTKLLSIGRLSPSKRNELIIETTKLIKDRGRKADLVIVGDIVLEKEREYKDYLKNLVSDLDLEKEVSFVGSVSYDEIPTYYNEADIFLNFSQTGSMDKTVLEAMACGCIPITSNEAFRDMLHRKDLFVGGTLEDVKGEIFKLKDMPNRQRQFLINDLREIIIKDHSLENLIPRIIEKI